MPRGVTWIQNRVRETNPDGQQVTLAAGRRVGYDALVVAPDLQIDWGKVRGLENALGRDGVCSIYDYRQAQTTSRMIDGFRGGRAVFTAPPPRSSAAGARRRSCSWLRRPSSATACGPRARWTSTWAAPSSSGFLGRTARLATLARFLGRTDALQDAYPLRSVRKTRYVIYSECSTCASKHR